MLNIKYTENINYANTKHKSNEMGNIVYANENVFER